MAGRLKWQRQPISPGSCCQIVASRFLLLSYHAGISGFRKAGEQDSKVKSSIFRWSGGRRATVLKALPRLTLHRKKLSFRNVLVGPWDGQYCGKNVEKSTLELLRNVGDR
jgi:hypothetical protein